MSAIEHLLKPHVRDIGEFTVRRLLPAAATQTVGPFIFFDHLGPVSMPPGNGMDVRPHPPYRPGDRDVSVRGRDHAP